VDGYTLRNVALKGLILCETAPPMEEIERFTRAGVAQDAFDSQGVSGRGVCRDGCEAEIWLSAFPLGGQVLDRAMPEVVISDRSCRSPDHVAN
jgi:hypothetical protein